VGVDYNRLFGWHLFFQRARGKTRVVEASPSNELYIRQRDYMERSYRSPPHENWKQTQYYTARSPQRGRSGSPAYTRIKSSQQRAWQTPAGHKRFPSPNYGEFLNNIFHCIEYVLQNEIT
jgi:hypothetical protein